MIMEKIQRFGGAMFIPVLLFSFSGIMVALCIIFKNPMLVGSIAAKRTAWYPIWSVVESGAWTVFNQMELLFVIGLPIGLVKKTSARVVMEAFVVYITCSYFISTMLGFYSGFLSVDFSADPGDTSGLKMIAGIRTLDTGITGVILISAVVVYLHSRFSDRKLPDFLGIYQGSSFIVIINFFIILPFAFLIYLIWPKIQLAISSLQGFLTGAGIFGVWLYAFLERILVPTGLHHFIYAPFAFGPAVVGEGITRYWMTHLREFARSEQPLKHLFPEGGFVSHGNSEIFASPGIAATLYFTARPENRKKVLTILIPATLTAVLAGITEPLELTFLFISPPLFAIHSLLATTMAAIMHGFGVVGDIDGRFIDLFMKAWIPLFQNHKGMIFTQLVISLALTGTCFIMFRCLVIKFNTVTTGREENTDAVKLCTKKGYEEEEKRTSKTEIESVYENQAAIYLEGFGGAGNIEKVTNCATHLRMIVKNEMLALESTIFEEGRAHGVVRNGSTFQVIVGLDMPQVREQFERLLGIEQ